jgi:putative endonuclease
MVKAKSWYVYIVECRGGRLYTGTSTDPARRYAEHKSGKRGAKFTRAHPPQRLLASLEAGDRSAALRLEAALRRLSRPEKLAWAARHPFKPVRGQ